MMTETHLSEDPDPKQQHLVEASATAVVDSPERENHMKEVTCNITLPKLCCHPCQTSENNEILSYIALINKDVLIQPVIVSIFLMAL